MHLRKYRDGWVIAIVYKKTLGTIDVKLENSRTNVSVEEFKMTIAPLIKLNPDFAESIIEGRKLMYAGVTSQSFDLEDKAGQRAVFEWVFKQLTNIIDSSKIFR